MELNKNKNIVEFGNDVAKKMIKDKFTTNLSYSYGNKNNKKSYRMREEFKNGMTELKYLRVNAGITCREICQEIGVSQGVYNLYENGERLLSEPEYEHLFWKVGRAIDKIKKTEDYQYTHINEDKLKKAVELHNKGYNIIKISVALELDELVIKREFKKLKIKPLEFINY